MATLYSTSSGNFSDPIWEDGEGGTGLIPDYYDSVVIRQGHEILYDRGYLDPGGDPGNTPNNWFEAIIIVGTLKFPTNQSSFLGIFDNFHLEGSLIIGEENDPIPAQHKVVISFWPYTTLAISNTGLWDGVKPNITIHGDMNCIGGVDKTFGYLALDWVDGDTFYLEGDYSGWQAGQDIVICYTHDATEFRPSRGVEVKIYEIVSVNYDSITDRTAIAVKAEYWGDPAPWMLPGYEIEIEPGVWVLDDPKHWYWANNTVTGNRCKVWNLYRNVMFENYEVRQSGDQGVINKWQFDVNEWPITQSDFSVYKTEGYNDFDDQWIDLKDSMIDCFSLIGFERFFPYLANLTIKNFAASPYHAEADWWYGRICFPNERSFNWYVENCVTPWNGTDDGNNNWHDKLYIIGAWNESEHTGVQIHTEIHNTDGIELEQACGNVYATRLRTVCEDNEGSVLNIIAKDIDEYHRDYEAVANIAYDINNIDDPWMEYYRINYSVYTGVYKNMSGAPFNMHESRSTAYSPGAYYCFINPIIEDIPYDFVGACNQGNVISLRNGDTEWVAPDSGNQFILMIQPTWLNRINSVDNGGRHRDLLRSSGYWYHEVVLPAGDYTMYPKHYIPVGHFVNEESYNDSTPRLYFEIESFNNGIWVNRTTSKSVLGNQGAWDDNLQNIFTTDGTKAVRYRWWLEGYDENSYVLVDPSPNILEGTLT